MTEKNISKMAGLAIKDYGMIHAGEKILVGVSGGMDSTALLLILQKRLARLPIRYELFPVMIDNVGKGSPGHEEKIGQLGLFIRKETGLDLRLVKTGIVDKLLGGKKPERDVCFLCSQKRRHELIQYAFRENFTKIALGHHLDDIVETSLINLFYKRELSTMIPRLSLFKGKLAIIRPLAYIQKHQIESYLAQYPVPVPVLEDNCPAKLIKKELRREKVRAIIANLAADIPNLKNNIFASFRNPKPDYLPDQFFDPKDRGLFRRP